MRSCSQIQKGIGNISSYSRYGDGVGCVLLYHCNEWYVYYQHFIYLPCPTSNECSIILFIHCICATIVAEMKACANDGNWKTALALMEEMAERGISPNEFTYSVAITACGNGGQWSKALELLDKMRSMNMKINTITYNSAISALAKAARTESKQQRRGMWQFWTMGCSIRSIQ
eukprot:CCRYP_002474-RC/>CCRYP_002474-RC protein AED:0.09 eAED:0.09 QI:1233/0.75/0.8/1/0/0/5/609/172